MELQGKELPHPYSFSTETAAERDAVSVQRLFSSFSFRPCCWPWHRVPFPCLSFAQNSCRDRSISQKLTFFKKNEVLMHGLAMLKSMTECVTDWLQWVASIKLMMASHRVLFPADAADEW